MPIMICAQLPGEPEARFYLLKSHIDTYTKKDGTVVAAHEDSRVAALRPPSGKTKYHKEYDDHMAMLDALSSNDVVYKRSASKKSARFERDGRVQHGFYGDNGATVPSDKDGAIAHLASAGKAKLESALSFAAEAKVKAAASKKKNDAIKATLATLKETRNESRGVIESAHMNRNLQFHPMPLADFSAKDTVSIFQSGGYGKKKGSEYRLVMIGNRPAYARESDHWGAFSTVERGLQSAPKLHEGDSYDGEEHWKQHNWKLDGVEKTQFGSGERYAGYVFLDDLVAMKGDNTMRKSIPQDCLQSIRVLFLKRHNTTNS